MKISQLFRSSLAGIALFMSSACDAIAYDAAPFQFGACIHLALNRSDAAKVSRALDSAGFSTFRDDVYWGPVERQQGVLRFPEQYAQLDLAVTAVRAAGGRPLLILDFGNTFYDNGGQIESEAGLAAFERYVRFVVRHFGNRVDQYEIWNEWNTGFGSKPPKKKGDAAAYARLLQRSYLAIKQENPAASVIGGAMSGVDLPWAREFVAAGGLQWLDAFSVHPYALFTLHPNPEGSIRALDKLRTVIRQEGARIPEPPILITEIGWPTSTGKMGVSEEKAAAYLVRFMMLARSRPWIRGVWWYDLIDDGDNSARSEDRFGLLARDLTPKPAYRAATRIAPLLARSVDMKAWRLKGGGYAVTGRMDGTPWLAAWTLEPQVLGWSDGIATEATAPPDLDWVEARLGEAGTPVLWNQKGNQWILVDQFW